MILAVPIKIAARDSCRAKRERINAGIRKQNPETIFLALISLICVSVNVFMDSTRNCIYRCDNILDFNISFYNNTGPRRADYTAPAHLGLEEIDGLLVPPGKTCTMLTIQINKQTPKPVLQY